MIKFFRKIYYRIFIFFLALKWNLFSVNPMDKVMYEGEEYYVNTAYSCDEWVLSKGEIVDVIAPKKKCKKVKSFDNYVQSFETGMNFYMVSWYDIWCRNGINPIGRKI